MQLEDVVVSGVTEFVRIYIILEYFKIFLNVHSLRRNIISCVITYIITLLSYLVFHNVLVNLIVTVAGEMLKKIGTNARYEIEKQLGNKVNLKLWVKVKKEWRDSDILIKNFGYDKKDNKTQN